MTDLLNILENIVGYLGSFGILMWSIFFLMGFIFVMLGLNSLKVRNEKGMHSQKTFGGALGYFIAGACMLAMPQLIVVLNGSLFATTAQSPSTIFSYAPNSVGLIAEQRGRDMIENIVMIVQFIGVIAIGRGIYLLNACAQGQQQSATMGQGLTFLFAGACGTNFPLFVGLMETMLSAPGAVTP